jgi:hypothetical protein
MATFVLDSSRMTWLFSMRRRARAPRIGRLTGRRDCRVNRLMNFIKAFGIALLCVWFGAVPDAQGAIRQTQQKSARATKSSPAQTRIAKNRMANKHHRSAPVRKSTRTVRQRKA